MPASAMNRGLPAAAVLAASSTTGPVDAEAGAVFASLLGVEGDAGQQAPDAAKLVVDLQDEQAVAPEHNALHSVELGGGRRVEVEDAIHVDLLPGRDDLVPDEAMELPVLALVDGVLQPQDALPIAGQEPGTRCSHPLLEALQATLQRDLLARVLGHGDLDVEGAQKAQK